MMNDPLASALSNIQNAERVGKQSCIVRPVSNMIKSVLKIMNDNGYIGSFEEFNDGRGGIIKINLIGRGNKIRVVKARFSVDVDEFEKFEKRYMPAKGFGIILISTNKGVMTHEKAINQHIGGKIIAYVY